LKLHNRRRPDQRIRRAGSNGGLIDRAQLHPGFAWRMVIY
jgi:hypothetical protein